MRIIRIGSVATAVLLATATTGDRVEAQSGLTLHVLSSRPDMVSGGDALVEVATRATPSIDGVRVTANGRDVSAAFRVDVARQSLVGLVRGLRLGANTVEARRSGRTSRLELVNHPIEGPIHKNPRLIAGGPLADDIAKCQLKPIDPRDYQAGFSPEELSRLRAIFPSGVCDYTKPGGGQLPLAGTYLRLPLPSGPTSTSARVPR